MSKLARSLLTHRILFAALAWQGSSGKIKDSVSWHKTTTRSGSGTQLSYPWVETAILQLVLPTVGKYSIQSMNLVLWLMLVNSKSLISSFVICCCYLCVFNWEMALWKAFWEPVWKWLRLLALGLCLVLILIIFEFHYEVPNKSTSEIIIKKILCK